MYWMSKEILRIGVSQGLVATYPERREGVGADFKTALVDPFEEFPEHALASLLMTDVHVFQLNHLFTWL